MPFIFGTGFELPRFISIFLFNFLIMLFHFPMC